MCRRSPIVELLVSITFKIFDWGLNRKTYLQIDLTAARFPVLFSIAQLKSVCWVQKNL